MTTITEIQTTQVHQVFIKATPEAIWDAITKPEFTRRYFHNAAITVTPERRETRGPNGEVWGDTDVVEYDPPRKLVHGWSSLHDPELAEEDESRVSWEIEAGDDGVSLLTVVHDKLEGAPKTASNVAGVGWMGVLSSLKSFLETGEGL
ncbi:MAG: SRPBCC domain-containing protein [Gaiellaceae bacterium]